MHSDDELYSQFLAGDPSSYDQLMIRYGDPLTFYLNGYTHDLQDAEDLMIDAFAKIMVKKPKIAEGSFKAYLYKTGRNLATRFHERRKHLVFGYEEFSEEIADPVLTEAILKDERRKEVLDLCLERIDPELKEALWLVYYEDLSYAQAAKIMNVSTKRIDHLLVRAKQHMRKELQKEGTTNAYE